MRRVLSLAAVAVVPAAVTAALAAAPAQAATTGRNATSAASAALQPGAVSIVIDSMSPQTAKPGSTVTVTGTVSNGTSQAETGLEVQLLTSPVRFQSRDQMEEYASQGTGASLEEAGNPFTFPATLKPGATAGWRASFQVDGVGMTEFGVYPVTAELGDAVNEDVATDQTLLPFWPGQQAADMSRPLDISWVWPLIDQPHRQVCSALTNNDLLASIAPGGRLSNLLDAGQAYPDLHLTWFIDPALVGDVNTMTRSYQVDSGSGCTGALTQHASKAAVRWISTLRTVTSSQPTVITPYANVDISALVHSGLTSGLAAAYATGKTVADSVLHGSFGSNIALPPGGTADLSVLTNLVTAQHIGTVVLDSNEMPQSNPAVFEPDDAVTSVHTPAGLTMNVLLADHVLTGVLAAGSGTVPASTQFAVSQRFLAETAMIAAEAPDSDRSIVVEPPEDWNPSAALADQLLSETAGAPWLQPTALGSLTQTTDSYRGIPRQSPPSNRDSPDELSAGYLNAIGGVATALSTYESMLYQPSSSYTQGLNEALTATESAAWRGGGQAEGLVLADKLLSFVDGEENLVKIIASQQVPMGGSSGLVPVSIQNGSHHPIRVRLKASVVDVPGRSSQLTVGHFQNLVTVQTGEAALVRLPVTSAPIGPTAIRFTLTTADGKPLPAVISLTVESTRYGRTILFLIIAAIGVLVLTSVFRGVRRWLGLAPQGEPEADSPAGTGSAGTGDETGTGTGTDVGAENAVSPGSVVTGTSSAQHPTEAPDDLADARRWADET
jgi:Family of unknown function (DUF6049)